MAVGTATKQVTYWAVIGADEETCPHRHVTVAEAQRCAERRQHERQEQQHVARIYQAAWR
jgi:hypothetical protein